MCCMTLSKALGHSVTRHLQTGEMTVAGVYSGVLAQRKSKYFGNCGSHEKVVVTKPGNASPNGLG